MQKGWHVVGVIVCVHAYVHASVRAFVHVHMCWCLCKGVCMQASVCVLCGNDNRAAPSIV